MKKKITVLSRRDGLRIIDIICYSKESVVKVLQIFKKYKQFNIKVEECD